MTFLVDGTLGGTFPSWTTATRPASPAVGQMGYNTTTGNFDQYTAAGWVGSLTNASQSIPKAALPTGSVIQVVQGTPTTTSTATTGTTYVATAATVTITPTSATSKILILHNGMIDIQASGVWCYYTLFRGATNLYVSGNNGAMGGVYINGGADNHVPSSINFLDSPATTSAVTYTVYIKSSNSGSNARYNADGWYMTINALEIAA